MTQDVEMQHLQCDTMSLVRDIIEYIYMQCTRIQAEAERGEAEDGKNDIH